MLIRMLLWINRRWHDYRDACDPHVSMRSEWSRVRCDE